jgi:hypothetical protein
MFMNKRVLEYNLSLCLHVSMHAPDHSEALYSCSLLQSLSILGLCPMHVKIPAPTPGALEIIPKPQGDHFLKKIFSNFH